MPPRNSSFRRTATLCAGLLLAFGALGATPAAAEIEIHVVNCTGTSGTTMTYDAKDTTRYLPYQVKQFGPNESHQGRCHGEGKGHCQVKICNATDSYAKGKNSCQLKNVDGGATVYVVGWEQYTNKPILADKPNDSCSKPASASS